MPQIISISLISALLLLTLMNPTHSENNLSSQIEKHKKICKEFSSNPQMVAKLLGSVQFSRTINQIQNAFKGKRSFGAGLVCSLMPRYLPSISDFALMEYFKDDSNHMGNMFPIQRFCFSLFLFMF